MAIGQVMAGYSLGMADLRIRKPFAGKMKKLIPEIRNEFVYGKKSLYDKDGVVIGISTEDSPNCVGAINNGFDEALALKIFKDMEAFAAYAFNKSHSAAYAFVGYRTAWLSLYYPVEWAIACMTLDTIDGKTDSVIATLNSCKKRNLKILPPDINESESSFSVGVMPDGTKGIRFGLLAIKGVGNSVLASIKSLVETDGKFTSFQDFLDRTLDEKTNHTLKNILTNDPESYTVKTDKDGNEFKSIRNPFAKRNIIPLIQAGAFDSLESNRFKLINEYINFRKVKAEQAELLDENEFHLKDKLSLELDLLGYYVSQHPLDGDVFPYVDLSQAVNGQKIKIAGMVRDFKKNPKPTKGGKTYYKLLLEFRDGTSMWINIWDNVYAKFGSILKGLGAKAKTGKEIMTVEGTYSAKNGFTNINVTNLNRIISKQEELEANEIPDTEDGIDDLVIEEKDNMMDEDLYTKVGGNNG